MNSTSPLFHHILSGAALFAGGRLGFQPEPGLAADLTAPPRTSEASSIHRSIADRIGDWLWDLELRERDAYLAKSANVFELEQRMRHWERNSDPWIV